MNKEKEIKEFKKFLKKLNKENDWIIPYGIICDKLEQILIKFTKQPL